MSPVEHEWRNSCLPSSIYSSKFNRATPQSPEAASSMLLPHTLCHRNFNQLIFSPKRLCFCSFNCKLPSLHFECRFFFIKTERFLKKTQNTKNTRTGVCLFHILLRASIKIYNHVTLKPLVRWTFSYKQVPHATVMQ